LIANAFNTENKAISINAAIYGNNQNLPPPQELKPMPSIQQHHFPAFTEAMSLFSICSSLPGGRSMTNENDFEYE
jgi:hypothetical protein